MVHRKLIVGPGLAAAALLAFGGIAGAQTPVGSATGLFAPWLTAPAAVVPAVAAVPMEPCDTEEASGPDTDNIQEGDQTGPDEATDLEEAGGLDTDTIQEGDQTGPDEACATDPAASAGTVATFTSAVKVQASAAKAHQSSASVKADAAPAEQGGETETSGESSTESNGPGGHEDTGANADHQFEGEE